MECLVHGAIFGIGARDGIKCFWHLRYVGRSFCVERTVKIVLVLIRKYVNGQNKCNNRFLRHSE